MPLSPAPAARAASRARRAAAGALVALLALGWLVLAGAAPAAAHNSLVSSFPAEGEVLESAPPQVELAFDADVSGVGLALVLTGPDGQPVALGRPAADGQRVTAPLSGAAAAGAYALDWRVVSADGHPVAGRLSFSVASGKPAPVGVQAAASAGAGDEQGWLSRNGGLLGVGGVAAVIVAYLAVDVARRRRSRAAEGTR
ncbi:copper resistance CopC family protein [Motilibacter aurantiacus]|uniref:copper resistance CopC family protein n=1 Tax=Motilibacter aurantiacus TaxID=2714955 RepID=UPI001407DD13|nr:copper resistance CopC family protein [Motilibacter aurantiacus]NHC45199.1 copper resistance protein CopC [Motilibacter aurantiacus]